MASKPRHIGKILRHQGTLASLYASVRQQQELLTTVRRELPRTLAPHCTGAILEGGRLTLSVDSPVWGSKLRFQAPRLLGRIRKHHPGVANIRVNVAVATKARATPTRKQLPRHSNRAAATVAQAGRDISDRALSHALQHLAKALREN